MLQLVLDAYIIGDVMSGIAGNMAKFLLGLATIVCNTTFGMLVLKMIQTRPTSTKAVLLLLLRLNGFPGIFVPIADSRLPFSRLVPFMVYVTVTYSVSATTTIIIKF